MGRRGAMRLTALAVLGGLMLALQVVLRGEHDPLTQVVGQLAGFAVFAGALALAWRGVGAGRAALVVVVLGAVAFRAAAFVPGDATPPLSSDVHRYAWDGTVQLAGINPYRYAPTDPALEHLRDDAIWPGINHKPWKTIYPPGAQAAFAASQAVVGHTVRSTTWLFLAAEAAVVWMLVIVLMRMRAPPERVLAYAWQPLVISEIAGNGHVDALAVLALTALMLAWTSRRRAVAGACVAGATLVKLGPILLVPALARTGGRRFVVAALAIVALAYVPFAVTVGTGVAGSLARFEAEERFNGSLDVLLSPVVGADASQALLAIGLLVVVALVARRPHEGVDDLARAAIVVLGGLLLVVDYVQPWHALVLTPFLAVTWAPGWTWVAGVLPLAYVENLHGSLPLWATAVIYVPLALAGAWRAWRSPRVRARVKDSIPSRTARTEPADRRSGGAPETSA